MGFDISYVDILRNQVRRGRGEGPLDDNDLIWGDGVWV